MLRRCRISRNEAKPARRHEAVPLMRRWPRGAVGTHPRRSLADFPPPPPPFPLWLFLPPPPPPPSPNARDRAVCTSRRTLVGGKDLLTSEPSRARAAVVDNCTLTVPLLRGRAVTPVPVPELPPIASSFLNKKTCLKSSSGPVAWSTPDRPVCALSITVFGAPEENSLHVPTTVEASSIGRPRRIGDSWRIDGG